MKPLNKSCAEPREPTAFPYQAAKIPEIPPPSSGSMSEAGGRIALIAAPSNGAGCITEFGSMCLRGCAAYLRQQNHATHRPSSHDRRSPHLLPPTPAAPPLAACSAGPTASPLTVTPSCCLLFKASSIACAHHSRAAKWPTNRLRAAKCASTSSAPAWSTATRFPR